MKLLDLPFIKVYITSCDIRFLYSFRLNEDGEKECIMRTLNFYNEDSCSCRGNLFKVTEIKKE